MRKSELFSLLINKEEIKIGFVDCQQKIRGKAKILSDFKEDKKQLMFEDDYLVLENSTKFNQQFNPSLFITNRCMSKKFTPTSHKYLVVKGELSNNMKYIFKLFCKLKYSKEYELHFVKELRLNRFQRIGLYQVPFEISVELFPKKIDDLEKVIESLQMKFKAKKSNVFYKIKDGVKTLV